MSNKLVKLTVAALITAGISVANESAIAAPKMEKCYGVAKAGSNDCGANGHPCAGQAKVDGDPNEWVLLPKGTCEKLVGGKVKGTK